MSQPLKCYRTIHCAKSHSTGYARHRLNVKNAKGAIEPRLLMSTLHRKRDSFFMDSRAAFVLSFNPK